MSVKTGPRLQNLQIGRHERVVNRNGNNTQNQLLTTLLEMVVAVLLQPMMTHRLRTPKPIGFAWVVGGVTLLQ